MLKDVHNSAPAEDTDGHLYDPGVRAAMGAFALGGDTLALEAAASVRSAAQAIDRLRSHGAGGRGLSSGALDVLARLGNAGEAGLSIGELARAGGVSSRNVTGLVDTLEGERLALRAQDPDDRRSVRVTITPEGHAWLESFRAPTQRAMAAVFRSFTPGELAAFRHLCLRVVANQRQLEQYLGQSRAPETEVSPT
ncbi:MULTISPECIES: MarR family transcriptional regulator [Kitasatospora]|uniref:Putative MarR family transcriptional regulator n=1 Tax=Kitasatospora setae (strain ATCC 33774 / DSM 43861 / JCM 3304 / KCC A-0304 / NBRC 14216 / KM-6054) TaxID=452652 RepID=E4N386_KITSK|nr:MULTISPECIES: MarR family transcriptional regulator [Kitasatospora]BAJ32620.1 putative MarR family transcriptional regulator [Kitasatospora setae KM-6054]